MQLIIMRGAGRVAGQTFKCNRRCVLLDLIDVYVKKVVSNKSVKVSIVCPRLRFPE